MYYTDFPVGKKYKIIYADPAWTYESDPNSKRGIWGLAQNEYKTMTFNQLKELPVKEITDTDSLLFLWATFPILPQAFELLKVWGFEYKTIAFVWIKEDRTNNTPKKYGLGWYTRSNCEVVLLGRKGKFDRKSASVKQIVAGTLDKHSKKPNEVRKRILQLCGDLPRIELFARIEPKGWDAWGNEPPKDQILEKFV